MTKGRKIAPSFRRTAAILAWKEFLAKGKGMTDVRVSRAANDPAVILYSGGTTGVTKGILLSNLNFNALGAQIIATNPMFAARRQDAGNHADVPRLRSGRKHPLDAGQRRPVRARAAASRRRPTRSCCKQASSPNFIAGVPTLVRGAAAHGRRGAAWICPA